MNSIPASKLVNIIPGVVGTGGNPLSLNAVLLTNDDSIPIGTVRPFSSADDVAAWFGAVSTEADLATTYFNGFNGATQLPSALHVAQYNVADVAAYVMSGSVAGLTLDALKALSGTLVVAVDGVTKTSSTISLTAATSFSNAATIIAAAFTAGPTCAYDSQLSRFILTSGTTGVESTIGFCTGTLSAGLLFTEALGATVSPGADTAVAATFMEGITEITANWASFFTTWEPVDADKIAFADWVLDNFQRYLYVAWDSSNVPATGEATASFGALLKAGEYDGTYAVWPNADEAAFICGTIASIDFSQTNGRIDFAYKSQAGMVATVTTSPAYDYLVANGYNFHAAFATANDRFVCHQPGQIAGKWVWLDPYVNQIYLNSQLQLGLMTMLMAVNSLPHNEYGREMQRSACQPAIKEALNNGSIRTGIELSDTQKAIINSQAGLDIAPELYSTGYYLQVLPATAQQRGLRNSGPMSLWYTDGGGIHTITMPSISIL